MGVLLVARQVLLREDKGVDGAGICNAQVVFLRNLTVLRVQVWCNAWQEHETHLPPDDQQKTIIIIRNAEGNRLL